MFNKTLNQFTRYSNAYFWFKRFECNVPRQKTLSSWSFGSQWPIIWTLISSCLPLWLNSKNCSINFSFLNPRLPSFFRLILDLYWLNLGLILATVEPTYCLRHSLHVIKQTTLQLLHSNGKYFLYQFYSFNFRINLILFVSTFY